VPSPFSKIAANLVSKRDIVTGVPGHSRQVVDVGEVELGIDPPAGQSSGHDRRGRRRDEQTDLAAAVQELTVSAVRRG
jgi:hypothetical protein